MGNVKQSKRTFVSIGSILIIAFLLLVNEDFVRAEEFEVISPNVGFDYFILLEGQSVSISTTQEAAADFHILSVSSIGNRTLTATLSMGDTDATGIWWLSMIGTGGKFWYDFKIGMIPVSGPTAVVDVSKDLSFGFASGGLLLTSPVSVDEPVTYSITLRGGS